MLRSPSRILLPIGALFLACANATSSAPGMPSVDATVGDPFRQCEEISDALPGSLTALRKRGPVLSLKTSIASEYCDVEKYKCRLLSIKMPGLNAELLEIASERVLSPLEIHISSDRWQLMKGARIGQELDELATFYGVDVPPNKGEFQICGESTCIEVAHHKGRVTGLRLDCQSSN